MVIVFSKGVLRTNYKELIILPTVCNYNLYTSLLILLVIIPSFSIHWDKSGKNNLSDAD
jgi:hypothetical protein